MRGGGEWEMQQLRTPTTQDVIIAEAAAAATAMAFYCEVPS